VIAIAGTKADLVEQRKVERDEAEEFARSVNALYME
jgi:hypothetical protein